MSMGAMKRQRRKAGQIVKIPLDQTEFAFGLVLSEPLVAFNKKRLSLVDDLDYDFSEGNVSFTIMVMNHAVISGRWPVVGQTPIPEWLRTPPKFCKVDALSGAESIYQEIEELAPNYERPAMPGECAGLEVAAVWEPEHVEDRLRDFFKGVPNKWVEQLRSNR